jgi:hypothetical protein
MVANPLFHVKNQSSLYSQSKQINNFLQFRFLLYCYKVAHPLFRVKIHQTSLYMWSKQISNFSYRNMTICSCIHNNHSKLTAEVCACIDTPFFLNGQPQALHRRDAYDLALFYIYLTKAGKKPYNDHTTDSSKQRCRSTNKLVQCIINCQGLVPRLSPSWTPRWYPKWAHCAQAADITSTPLSANPTPWCKTEVKPLTKLAIDATTVPDSDPATPCCQD